MNPTALVVIGLVCGLTALLLLILVAFPAKHDNVSIARLKGISSGTTKKSSNGALSHYTLLTVNAINQFLERRGTRYTMATTLELAGLKLRPADFIIWVAAATGVSVLVLFLLGLPAVGVLMLAMGPLLAWAAIKVLTGRRQAEFAEQLGDTLQLMSGGMRAGHSLMHAIDAAASDSDAPMSEELARVVNEARLGRDTGASLVYVATRMQSEDFMWVAQAIEINREAGGDLAEVLDHVGDTIRDRSQIRRQVDALSAEGRMSALVLITLPIFVAIALFVITPGYFAPLLSSPIGIVVAIACLVLLALGGLWLRAIIKIKF